MNEKTKRFIKSKFQDYYRTAEIHLPPDFTSREWGFILFDEMPEFVMRRHKAFISLLISLRVNGDSYYLTKCRNL
jgi:DNA primase small subunit